MTTDEFDKTVADWLATARHPRFNRPYTEMVYRPMLELLAYLRGNGFKTFIVSGGGVEFMRVFAEQVYGIPPEQVVGSSGVVRFEVGADGRPVLIKEPKVEFIDDGPGKPVGINRFIGRQPIFAFGNSNGDQQMLEYTAGGSGARFMGLVHHTDAQREWAYDREFLRGQALDGARRSPPARLDHRRHEERLARRVRRRLHGHPRSAVKHPSSRSKPCEPMASAASNRDLVRSGSPPEVPESPLRSTFRDEVEGAAGTAQWQIGHSRPALHCRLARCGRALS